MKPQLALLWNQWKLAHQPQPNPPVGVQVSDREPLPGATRPT
jgi:hypothetical protein